MRDLSPDLRDAIEHAYRVFPAQRLRKPIGVCKCGVCVSDAHEVEMIATPRREWPLYLIREFNNSAHDEADDLLHHVLPRMLELTALGESICSLDETLGFKRLGLRHSHIRGNWPAQEVAAVDACFAALFRQALHARPDGFLFDDGTRGLGEINIGWLIESLAVGGADIAMLLAIWDGDESRLATLQAADLMTCVAPRLISEDRKPGLFWDYVSDAGEAALRDWLRRSEHFARFDRAMQDEPDQASFALLQEARWWCTPSP